MNRSLQHFVRGVGTGFITSALFDMKGNFFYAYTKDSTLWFVEIANHA